MDRFQRVYMYNTWILSSLVNVEKRTGFKGQADSLATTGGFPGGEEGDQLVWYGSPFALDEAFLHLLRLAPTPIIRCRANEPTVLCT